MFFFPLRFSIFSYTVKKAHLLYFSVLNIAEAKDMFSLILLNMRLDVLYRCAIYWLIKNDFS